MWVWVWVEGESYLRAVVSIALLALTLTFKPNPNHNPHPHPNTRLEDPPAIVSIALVARLPPEQEERLDGLRPQQVVPRALVRDHLGEGAGEDER